MTKKHVQPNTHKPHSEWGQGLPTQSDKRDGGHCLETGMENMVHVPLPVPFKVNLKFKVLIKRKEKIYHHF